MAGRAALSLVLLYSLAFLSAAQQNNVAGAAFANASANTDYTQFPASSVTDGYTSWANNRCFHSNDPAQTNWLRVYLDTVYPMQSIVVYYRSGFAQRFEGAKINILNSTDGPALPCTTVVSSSLDTAQLKGSFSCSTSGSIVEIRKDGGTLNICEVQVFLCPSNTYGAACTRCGQCIGGAACETTGRCPGACVPGWTGEKCDTQCGKCQNSACHQTTAVCPSGGCQSGWWGNTCATQCSIGCQQMTCAQSDGACTACVNGWWGTTCNLQCSIRCEGQTCHRTTGACTAGCVNGWYGAMCDQQCSNNCHQLTCAQTSGDCTKGCTGALWGPKCDKQCSSNCLQGSCNQTNGACTAGCQSGWMGPMCNETCQAGSYGVNCTERCGRCLQETCHHVTGDCTGGCQSGWRGPRCDQECESGRFGSNCSLDCGECQNKPCHHVNGSCFGGCVSGKTGDLCKDECPKGKYGIGCASICGKCLHVSCRDDGSCLGPCQDGWMGVNCNQICIAGQYGNNCNSSCGSCRNNATCNHVTGHCPAGCKAGRNGDLCLQECPDGTFGEGCTATCGKCAGGEVCDKVDGTCTACRDGFVPLLCQTVSVDHSAIIGGAVGGSLAFILLLVVVVLAVCLVRRRRQQKGPNKVPGRPQRLTKRKKPLSTVEDVEGYFNVAMEETAASSSKLAVRARKSQGPEQGGDVRADVEASPYYNEGAAPTHSDKGGIPVAKFPDYVKTMRAEKKFQAEYESISSDFLKPYAISQRKEHAGKNKFKTYYPYDENRVVLDPIAGDPSSHYINASHVDGFDLPKAFIAAQAPTKVTLSDFLRMIWQQNCSHVIMLANLWEEGRAKCERYFPEKVGDNLKAGEITATLTQETVKSYCVIRQMTFSHETGETRTIQQFHFTTWPDHGVPSHVDMLDFFWKVRASWTPDSGPMLVHCSAGVGRTGTFIALCILSDQAASQHRVDPLATLTALRHQRRNMIQTLDQYEFLYEVLERVLVFGKTAVSRAVFADHYKRLKGKTFMGLKTVDQIKKLLPDLCVARKVEKFHAFDENNVYSNTWNYQDAAVHLSSVRLSQGCVMVRLSEVGQDDVTPKGLWSFLTRISSTLLVDVYSAQRACVRQPDEAGEMEDGALTVQWQAPAALGSGVALRSVLVKDEDKETQVTYLSYHGKKAESSRGLVPAVSHLCNLQLSASPSPITFIYRDASDEQTANMLCASLNIAEAILTDSEVELVNNVLRVNAKFTPEMVVQCAEFARAFMQVTDVYANA